MFGLLLSILILFILPKSPRGNLIWCTVTSTSFSLPFTNDLGFWLHQSTLIDGGVADNREQVKWRGNIRSHRITQWSSFKSRLISQIVGCHGTVYCCLQIIYVGKSLGTDEPFN